MRTSPSLEGYRRLAFMMLDSDVVAVSPSSVYRVLRDAGLIKHHNSKPSLKMSRYSLTVPDPHRNLVEEQLAIPSPDGFRGRRYGIARLTLPTKVPSDSLGRIGSLQKIRGKPLRPIALES